MHIKPFYFNYMWLILAPMGESRDEEFFERNATPERYCLVHPMALCATYIRTGDHPKIFPATPRARLRPAEFSH
jgi:hypothetical protein